MFKSKILLPVLAFGLIALGLLFALYLSTRPKGAFDIRKKAADVKGSTLSFFGPSQVHVGDKFSVDVILDTTNDPDYTISGVDAVISANSQGIKPSPPPVSPNPSQCPLEKQCPMRPSVDPASCKNQGGTPVTRDIPCCGTYTDCQLPTSTGIAPTAAINPQSPPVTYSCTGSSCRDVNCNEGEEGCNCRDVGRKEDSYTICSKNVCDSCTGFTDQSSCSSRSGCSWTSTNVKGIQTSKVDKRELASVGGPLTVGDPIGNPFKDKEPNPGQVKSDKDQGSNNTNSNINNVNSNNLPVISASDVVFYPVFNIITLTGVNPGSIFDSYPVYPKKDNPNIQGIQTSKVNNHVLGIQDRESNPGLDKPNKDQGSNNGTNQSVSNFSQVIPQSDKVPFACPVFPGCPPENSKIAWYACWGDANIMCPSATVKPVPVQQFFPHSFTISGLKNYSVDSKGNFLGFTGKGIFATLTFTAQRAGKAELKFVWKNPNATDDTNINGYLVNTPVAGQKTLERLLSAPVSYTIEVVPSENPTVTPPIPTNIVPTSQITPVATILPTNVLTPTPPSQAALNFQLLLEARTRHDTLVDIYAVPVPNILNTALNNLTDNPNYFKLGSATTNTLGQGKINVDPKFIGQSFYLYAQTPSHLRKVQENTLPVTISSGDNPVCGDLAACKPSDLFLDFGTLTAGDIYTDSGGNKDNVINAFDVAELYSLWSLENNNPQDVEKTLVGDLNGDGVVNTVDLAILLANYGKKGSIMMIPSALSLSDKATNNNANSNIHNIAVTPNQNPSSLFLLNAF